MKVLKAVLPLQAELDRIRGSAPAESRVGFVPTMGALHRGHADLIRRARRSSQTVVVSIFVNPLQFGPQEDLARYPRDLAKDLRICRQAGADIVFAPEPGPFLKMKSLKKVPAAAGLKKNLCGPFRPGHFDGVTTIVAHFFRIIRPDLAFFGLKDYQQYRVIEEMTHRIFKKSIQIVPVETVREKNGLAMSSRNRYLTADEKKIAPRFFKALHATRLRIAGRQFVRAAEAETYLRGSLRAAGFDPVQYATVCDAKSLSPLAEELSPGAHKILIAAAVFLGRTRLIDNVLV